MKVFGILLTMGAVLGLGCNQQSTQNEQTESPSLTGSEVPTATAPVTNVFATLQGKWQRGDGDYVLEIRTATAGGALDAGYFNPAAINVSQARATSTGGTLQIFVELRDVNYPGCTYKLTFDAVHDQLFGQYYQAALQQTYDVVFARLK